jgi:hypothetical protein
MGGITFQYTIIFVDKIYCTDNVDQQWIIICGFTSVNQIKITDHRENSLFSVQRYCVNPTTGLQMIHKIFE